MLGLETLGPLCPQTGPRGLPMCSPMSQPGSLRSLLPEVSSMSPQMDFSEFFPTISASPARQYQGNAFWETQSQAFPSSSNPDWMRGSDAQNAAPSFPSGYSFGGVCRALIFRYIQSLIFLILLFELLAVPTVSLKYSAIEYERCH